MELCLVVLMELGCGSVRDGQLLNTNTHTHLLLDSPLKEHTICFKMGRPEIHQPTSKMHLFLMKTSSQGFYQKQAC